MVNLEKSEIDIFIKTNDEDTLRHYLDKLWSNLEELNKREEKYSLWLVIVFLLFLVLKNASIESYNIGPVTFKDISIISKVLPLVFVYTFFNLGVVSAHKKDVNETIKTLSEKLFKQTTSKQTIKKEFSGNFVVRMFLPYSFSNSIMKLLSKSPTTIEAVVGFPLMLPVLIFALVPYILTIIMICDLWKNYTNDIFGKICFWTTVWAFSLSIFYIFKNGLDNKKI